MMGHPNRQASGLRSPPNGIIPPQQAFRLAPNAHPGQSSPVFHGALNQTMARTKKENGSSSDPTTLRGIKAGEHVDTFRRDLHPDLRADYVLANGSMSSNQSGEGDIRRALIEADLVDCMVALPGQLKSISRKCLCVGF